MLALIQGKMDISPNEYIRTYIQKNAVESVHFFLLHKAHMNHVYLRFLYEKFMYTHFILHTHTGRMSRAYTNAYHTRIS